MALKWHPDKNQGKPTEKEATAKFQKISAAYKLLTEASGFLLARACPRVPATVTPGLPSTGPQ